jgi:hypothetical protein
MMAKEQTGKAEPMRYEVRHVPRFDPAATAEVEVVREGEAEPTKENNATTKKGGK